MDLSMSATRLTNPALEQLALNAPGLLEHGYHVFPRNYSVSVINIVSRFSVICMPCQYGSHIIRFDVEGWG
jgi:hypothetical protein